MVADCLWGGLSMVAGCHRGRLSPGQVVSRHHVPPPSGGPPRPPSQGNFLIGWNFYPHNLGALDCQPLQSEGG